MQRNIKQGVLLLAVFSFITSGLSAQQRKIDDILSIAHRHFEKAGQAATRGGDIRIVPSSEFIALHDDDEEAFYLCQSPSAGFVLVSGNVQLPEILGYSEAGYDPVRGLPPGLLSVMQSYAELSDDANSFKAPSSAQAVVSPLLKTAWDQGDPYNRMCPRDGATRSMVGCIATAAAQVMKYYEWPKKYGSGKIKYTTKSKNIAVSIDLSDYNFAWDMMLDTYPENQFSNAQATAVAKLMHAVGAACQMDYSNVESASHLGLCAEGLYQYFGYDKDMYLLLGSSIPAERWNEFLIDELNQSRPVMMSGTTSNTTGHAFVLDGYEEKSGNIYYHVNWGWSGAGNGNYLINKLSPTQGGTGMGLGSFNDNQLIVLNCMPDDGKDNSVYGSIAMAISESDFNSGEAILFKLTLDQLFCSLATGFSGSFLLELVNENGKVVSDIEIPGIALSAGDVLSGNVDGLMFAPQPDGFYTLRTKLKSGNGSLIELLAANPWPVIQVGATAIDEIEQEKHPSSVYDLFGRAKKNADNQAQPAGIYIVNGKKVLHL